MQTTANEHTEIRISRGLDIPFAGPPDQSRIERAPVAAVAIVGTDHPGLRPVFAVEPGERVAAGQRVLFDRRRPEIAHVAPASGTVRAITRGPRRSLDALVIDVDGEAQDDAARSFDVPEPGDRAGLVSLLAESGMWPALRARPFGRVPDLQARPGALFVTAIDTAPLAPDPATVIAAHPGWFSAGVRALACLAEGPTYLCVAAGAAIAPVEGTRRAAFSGPHPAGLPGTHIHHLHPVGHQGSVWQIGYQDVIAIGCLLETGRVWTERVVAVAGPAAATPGLVRVSQGANLRDLARDRVDGPAVLLSGSPLDGRQDHYLGRYHLQVTAMPHRAPSRERKGLIADLAAFLARRPQAVVPNAAHERAAPADILPIPFLRAIGIGDAETAARLGALELVEEDMALLSHVDGVDYGALLRRTLDDLEAAL